MIIIYNKNTDPYFNIASEEYFLHNFSEDIFLIYQNQPSVIVGKHQNAVKEVNQKFIFTNKLPVIRRITGGGTVYHDLGNINFSFILNGEKGKLIDFKRYTQPIVDFLQQIGIDATLGERNNIFIHSLKISGNAEHVFKKRVLHHGTLLFNSNLEDLEKSIKTDQSDYNDKSVKSVKSNVTNIQNHLSQSIPIQKFIQQLMSYIKELYGCKNYKININDELNIQKFIDEKYSKWEWNYGYSPVYQLTRKIEIDNKTLFISIEVKKGIIENINLNGDLFSKEIIEKIQKGCTGIRHDYSDIFHIFNSLNFNKLLLEKIIDNLF